MNFRRSIAPVIAFLVVIALTVGCGPATGTSAARSGGTAALGYRLGPEYPCTEQTAPGCGIAVATATRKLKIDVPGAVITRTAMADPRCGDVGVLCTFAGLTQPVVVVFDLADGSRHYVGLMCGGPVTTQDGIVVSPRTCAPADLPLRSP